jgi:hypothetical protein
MAKRRKISENEILKYESAVKMIVKSIVSGDGEIPQNLDELSVSGIMNFLSLGTTNYDRKSLLLLAAVAETDEIRQCLRPATDLFNYLRIDRRQLDFVERFLGLDRIVVTGVKPEGKRAFVPLLAHVGVLPDFNRVYIYGTPAHTVSSLDKQREYLGRHLGTSPSMAKVFSDGNYFVFEGVGSYSSLADVYVCLGKKHANRLHQNLQ